MPVNSHLLKRLTLPPIFVAVNFNQGTVHSFLTYNQASRGCIRLVRRKPEPYDPFFCLFRLNRHSGSRAKPLGRFGRFPTLDYDPNQCWGEWNTWDAEEDFIPKGRKKRHAPRSIVNVEPFVTHQPYQTEMPVDSAFIPETPTRFQFYVDRRELMVRPVLIRGRSEDGQILFDWPCMGSWGRGAVDNDRYFHGTAEWAMDQLLELMEEQGSLKPWIGDGDDE